MPTPRLEAKPSLRRPAILAPVVLDVNGGGDFDLHHWRRVETGYTSLRDILPSSSSSSSTGGSLLSPSAAAIPRAGEIQIRNRLVQQAAYAYLQPTPSLESSRRHRHSVSLRRLFAVLSCGLAGFCFHFVGRFLQSIRRSRR